YNWPAGVGAVAALYACVWLALAFPAAREEYAAAWRDIRGYQIAVVILFLSCYVEGFLSDIALRASSALQESPANPANLGRIGLIGAGALVAFYLGRARLDELPRGFSGPLRGIFCFAAVAVLSS